MLRSYKTKFYDLISSLNQESLKKSRKLIGFNYCEKIYKAEKNLRESYSKYEKHYDIRFNERRNILAPILDDFLLHIDREIKNALPKSPFGKALDYAKKHVPSLKNVLLNGALEIDNYATERKIKQPNH